MELPQAIPVRTYITVRADAVGLSTNACVRHCVWRGGKYLVGVEFSSPLKVADPRFVQALKRAIGKTTPGTPPLRSTH
jgi:hypothetical protein